MEGIGIFHQEFTCTHDAETWPDFVTELGLYLVVVHRQLLIAADLAPGDIGNDLFMCRSETELALVTVMETQQFRAILFPATGFLPQFGRLYRRHQQFQCTGAFHLFAHNGLDLAQHPQAEG